ncbi:MAG: hypothetical protein AUG75_21730 [Cyanobacteria bacterium 13_1_20CM_4_61_6]|nr:MAG: hypothetical protein AUG75_21730 [Cyanobacteria bacterium 13_1_20CM_4_61_6]
MKMAMLMDDIRKTPIFRQLIPQEAGIGWPIPLRRNEQVFVTLPFFCFSYKPQNKETTLYPPFATITLNWSSQVPVEYVNLRFRNPWPEGDWQKPAGIFPHLAVAKLSVKQYQDVRNELLSMYDVLLDALSRNEVLAPEWKTAFSLLLRTLVEPSLEQYYRALGQKFFATFLPPLTETILTT